MSAVAVRTRHWQVKALCHGVVGIDFLADDDPRQVKRAKTVCDRCPVKAECLEHAVEKPELFGVWGGTTPEERGVSMPQGGCLSCGGATVIVSATQERCLSCGDVWYVPT